MVRRLGLSRILPRLVLALAAAFLAWEIIAITIPHTEDSTDSLDDALSAVRYQLTNRDFANAERRLHTILEQHPDCVPAFLLLGQAKYLQGNLDAALSVLDELPESSDADVLAGRVLAADLSFKAGRLSDAEVRLRGLRNRSPEARTQLAYLLAITGRAGESRDVLLSTLNDRLPFQHLFWIAYPRSVVAPPAIDQLKSWQAAGSPDVWVLVALASHYLDEGRVEEAQSLLGQVLDKAPENPVADALQGRILLEQKDWLQLQRWQSRKRPLPLDASIWKLIGEAALAQDDHSGATRAFLEYIRLNPDDQEVSYQVGQLLRQSGNEEIGDVFVARSEYLKQLRALLTELAANPQEFEKSCSAIELLVRLGRLKEANSWLTIAYQISPNAASVRALHEQLLQAESNPTPEQRLSWRPFESLDVESFSMPRSISRIESSEPAASPSKIHLVDMASDAGLRFKFQNLHDPAQTVMRMHEFTGGGVAIIDLDGDQRPDVYFPQGGNMPQGSGVLPPQDTLNDQCFRNINGQHFEDVTSNANLANDRYAQGATVGDINNDGFSDLYVTNIGTNCLFMNNGDGTFSKPSSTEFSLFSDWTTSSALADMTGDGFPDIYDVNYLAGDNVFSLRCTDSKQVPRSCKPTIFPAGPDRFWENMRDGTFIERSEDYGLTARDGRGLGIVVFRDDSENLPSLFVANDGEANFCFSPQVSDKKIHYEETGVSKGLAFDGAGLSQACMGIAASDLNNDGDTELFVTNFYHESNTLYSRNSFGFYDDVTRLAGLREPSLPMLGFGTQFLDLDRDGQLDLLVANGHEGNYLDLGIPFQMSPQAFRGQGDLRFEELSHNEVGPYFEGKYLGRGMAVLDWNRDLKPDACVTHLDAPAALLTNQTQSENSSIQLQLIGLASGRDAIGGQVRIVTTDSEIRREVTAGDGYLSCNERRLLIGFGKASDIREIRIQWPSGSVDVIHGPITLNKSYVAIEGRGCLTLTQD